MLITSPAVLFFLVLPYFCHSTLSFGFQINSSVSHSHLIFSISHFKVLIFFFLDPYLFSFINHSFNFLLYFIPIEFSIHLSLISASLLLLSDVHSLFLLVTQRTILSYKMHPFVSIDEPTIFQILDCIFSVFIFS